MYRTGLIVGKFSPLHRGHELLILTAARQCERLIVLSYSSPEFPGCEREERQYWFEHVKNIIPPWVEFLVVDPKQLCVRTFDGRDVDLDVPFNDEDEYQHREFCANVLLQYFHTTADVVFSSEDYGPGFATFLEKKFKHKVEHVMVDQSRSKYAISGTTCRQDRAQLLAMTDEEVTASFVRRVVILGGESSGKTVLAQALRNQLDTRWVPEYGREYCDYIGGVENLRYGDMLHIGEKQVAIERWTALEMVRNGQFGKPLICDTSPLTTLFYTHQMFPQPQGRVDPRLITLSKRRYDITILCAPTFPFVQDGTRQDEQFRELGHQWYLEKLKGKQYTLVTGTVAERVAQVVKVLENLDGYNKS